MAETLATLPEGQRRAIELHHLEGWPLAEIAIELETTKAAVAGLLASRAQEPQDASSTVRMSVSSHLLQSRRRHGEHSREFVRLVPRLRSTIESSASTR